MFDILNRLPKINHTQGYDRVLRVLSCSEILLFSLVLEMNKELNKVNVAFWEQQLVGEKNGKFKERL